MPQVWREAAAPPWIIRDAGYPAARVQAGEIDPHEARRRADGGAHRGSLPRARHRARRVLVTWARDPLARRPPRDLDPADQGPGLLLHRPARDRAPRRARALRAPPGVGGQRLDLGARAQRGRADPGDQEVDLAPAAGLSGVGA